MVGKAIPTDVCNCDCDVANKWAPYLFLAQLTAVLLPVTLQGVGISVGVVVVIAGIGDKS